MDILKDMVEHILLDFDRTLLVDEEYTGAEERLHSFIKNVTANHTLTLIRH